MRLELRRLQSKEPHLISVKMVTKMVFLLSLLGAASSELPLIRRCDPEQRQETPTLCSNYKNILHLHGVQTKLQEKEMALQRRMDAVEGETRLRLESTNGNIAALERLVTNLSDALRDLEGTRSRTEREYRDAKTQLERHDVDIVGLRREVDELVEHGERAWGNFGEIRERLDATERQLREKKAKLDNLEVETEAAFNDTQELLNLFKDELSRLNSTTWELEVKVEARLDAAATQLQAKLKKIQNDSEAFSARLNEQKADVEGFKDRTDGKFGNVDEKLNTQEAVADRQEADIDALKNECAVRAQVAFSATVIESCDVFTGPNSANTSSILIFNRVFINVGNAYNSTTGVFTAPLKGVYHFTIVTFGYNGHTSGAILVRNGRYQVSTWESTGPDASDTASNTVILELNASDAVNVILWDGGKIHTSVFSGFLVFTTS